MSVSEQAVQAAWQAFDAKGGYSMPEKLHAALTAALPFLQGVKVKGLEWVDHQHGSRCVTDRVYDISIWMEGDKPLYVDSYTTMRRFRLMNEAKAAAQADYSARILSAIEPAPSPRAQALEEKPAAYLRQKDIDRLSSCHPGAINVQIANKPFMSFTVPVFAALSSQPVSTGGSNHGE